MNAGSATQERHRRLRGAMATGRSRQAEPGRPRTDDRRARPRRSGASRVAGERADERAELAEPKIDADALGVTARDRGRAYTMKIAKAMLLKRFEVPVAPRSHAGSGGQDVPQAHGDLLAHRRTPAGRSSWRSGAGLRPADRDDEQRRDEEADRVEEDRDRRRRTPMRTPPSARPEVCDASAVISSFELPSTSWSRFTSDGRYDWYATSKKTVEAAVQRSRRRRAARSSGRRAAKATGIVSRASARPTSPTIRIGRRRRRSTQTPAGRLSRMNGRNSMVARSPTSNGDTFRMVAAMRGRASCVTWVPRR